MMIGPDLRTTMPMLASPTEDAEKALAGLGADWVFQPKWDGVRALVYVSGGTVRIRNRVGTEITSRYPDVVAQLAAAFPRGEYVFDGELLVFGPDGRPDFTLIARRDSQANSTKISLLAKQLPATFLAFDLLHHGEDLRRAALQDRLVLLEQALRGKAAPTLTVTGTDGASLWAFVCEHGLEGLVAKHRHSAYHPRRHHSWVKLKRLHRVTAIVTGFDAGKGARAGKVGALHLALLDGAGALVPVGRVGTGFKAADHAPLLALLERGEFLVEVEYMGVQKAALRMPSFKGTRTDVELSACTLDQLVHTMKGAWNGEL